MDNELELYLKQKPILSNMEEKKIVFFPFTSYLLFVFVHHFIFISEMSDYNPISIIHS